MRGLILLAAMLAPACSDATYAAGRAGTCLRPDTYKLSYRFVVRSPGKIAGYTASLQRFYTESGLYFEAATPPLPDGTTADMFAGCNAKMQLISSNNIRKEAYWVALSSVGTPTETRAFAERFQTFMEKDGYQVIPITEGDEFYRY